MFQFISDLDLKTLLTLRLKVFLRKFYVQQKIPSKVREL